MREAHPAPSEGSRAPARTARPLLPLGEGVGIRDDPPHPLPSPGGRGEVGKNLHLGRNEGEGVLRFGTATDTPYTLQLPPSPHPSPARGEGEFVR